VIGEPAVREGRLSGAATAPPPIMTRDFTHTYHVDIRQLKKPSTMPQHAILDHGRDATVHQQDTIEPATDHLPQPIFSPSQEATREYDAQVDDGPNNRVVTRNIVDYSGCPGSLDCFCALTALHKRPSSPTTSKMSCQTAASIIVDMHGFGDTDSIRMSLGCTDFGQYNTTMYAFLNMIV
jgi:hypothetical protein